MELLVNPRQIQRVFTGIRRFFLRKPGGILGPTVDKPAENPASFSYSSGYESNLFVRE
jgi:hypothetical protein